MTVRNERSIHRFEGDLSDATGDSVGDPGKDTSTTENNPANCPMFP